MAVRAHAGGNRAAQRPLASDACLVTDVFGRVHEVSGPGQAIYDRIQRLQLLDESAAAQWLATLRTDSNLWTRILQRLRTQAEPGWLMTGDATAGIANLITSGRIELRRLPSLDAAKGVSGVDGCKYCFVPGPVPLPPYPGTTHIKVSTATEAAALLGKLQDGDVSWTALLTKAGQTRTSATGTEARQALLQLLERGEVLAYSVRSTSAERTTSPVTAAAAGGATAARRMSPRAPDPPPSAAPASRSAAAAKPAAPSPIPATAKNLAVPAIPSAAPREINLAALQGTFDTLWSSSFPGGVAQEHGGTLVSDAKGALSVVNTGAGRQDAFTPNLAVGPGQSVLGVFHTHPYDATEGGHTGVSLSGGDAAYMIATKQNLIIAQSGTEQFMYLRTAATTPTVDFNALNNSQNQRVMDLMTAGKDFSEASKTAAMETAKSHGMAYYEGTAGAFKRVYP